MSLTVSQLAACIPGDQALAKERLKHWIKSKLIKPVGMYHPGTGRHLGFPADTAIDVVIMSTLADFDIRLVEVQSQLRTPVRGALARGQDAWRTWWRQRELGKSVPLFLFLPHIRNQRRGGTNELAVIGSAPTVPPGIGGHWLDLGLVFTQATWPQELTDAVRKEDSK